MEISFRGGDILDNNRYQLQNLFLQMIVSFANSTSAGTERV